MSRPLVALSALLLLQAASAAASETTAPTDTEPAPAAHSALGFGFGVGLRMHGTTSIDLAGLADAEGYGAANDAGPAALGLTLSAELIVTDAWSVVAEGLLAFGGLGLADIEERYFGAEPEPIGGTSTVAADLAARYRIDLAPSWGLVVGAGAGAQLMGASSPVGGGFFRAVQVGPEVELLYGAGAAESGSRVGLGIDGSVLVPYHVSVSGGEELFAAESGMDPVYQVGVALTWRYVRR